MSIHPLQHVDSFFFCLSSVSNLLLLQWTPNAWMQVYAEWISSWNCFVNNDSQGITMCHRGKTSSNNLRFNSAAWSPMRAAIDHVTLSSYCHRSRDLVYFLPPSGCWGSFQWITDIINFHNPPGWKEKEKNKTSVRFLLLRRQPIIISNVFLSCRKGATGPAQHCRIFM